MADVCCGSNARAPIVYDYTPKGKLETIADGLEAYVVEGTKPAAIVVVMDIFGLQDFPQVKQVSDLLSAATGCAVAVPDVFHSKPWSMDRLPPKAPQSELLGWIAGEVAFSNVSKDLDKTVEALRARGCGKFGVIGFCWGASIALQAGAASGGAFSAVAGVHPSLFGRDAELAAAVTTPVALVAAKGDPLEAVRDAVVAKGGALAAKSVWLRFDDMEHGFCAARGDFRDANVARRAGEAVDAVAAFFVDVLAL